MKKSKFPGEKSVALLLDPDKSTDESLFRLLGIAEQTGTDYIFAGGSVTFKSTGNLVELIKQRSALPVVLFPGNLLQLTDKADKILLLSLISGRNPDLLIGNHVLAAPFLAESRQKLVPTGYILINCGSKTSVEYISQTEAIPSDKTDIVVATAMAGEMLGLRMIYLEAGSGAERHVPLEIISSVRKNTGIPLAVGGGIKTSDQVRSVFEAGANLVILGNGCENNPQLLADACAVRDTLLSRAGN
jgi:putative glycerol-1-phosphate prenyltransferase